jgi:hypothetical protein
MNTSEVGGIDPESTRTVTNRSGDVLHPSSIVILMTNKNHNEHLADFMTLIDSQIPYQEYP